MCDSAVRREKLATMAAKYTQDKCDVSSAHNYNLFFVLSKMLIAAVSETSSGCMVCAVRAHTYVQLDAIRMCGAMRRCGVNARAYDAHTYGRTLNERNERNETNKDEHNDEVERDRPSQRMNE